MMQNAILLFTITKQVKSGVDTLSWLHGIYKYMKKKITKKKADSNHKIEKNKKTLF